MRVVSLPKRYDVCIPEETNRETSVRERPIIFSSAMVQAILAGARPRATSVRLARCSERSWARCSRRCLVA